jgi:hypothetical protein
MFLSLPTTHTTTPKSENRFLSQALIPGPSPRGRREKILTALFNALAYLFIFKKERDSRK